VKRVIFCCFSEASADLHRQALRSLLGDGALAVPAHP
jgi:hypothetical protein